VRTPAAVEHPARLVLAFAGLALGSGCVLDVEITAGFDANGALVFESEQRGSRHWCLDRFKVVDRATRQVMWEIDTEPGTSRPQFCEDDFPLAYGAVPAGLSETTPPEPLVGGHTYDVTGDSGNMLSGVFRYEVRRRVTNTGKEPIWD
jgi:hypothetical protein